MKIKQNLSRERHWRKNTLHRVREEVEFIDVKWLMVSHMILEPVSSVRTSLLYTFTCVTLRKLLFICTRGTIIVLTSQNYFVEGNGNPLQYSCLENHVDRGAWWAAVHGVSQSQTRLKWLSLHACIGEGNDNPLQCSCWRIPGTEKPGGLLSMGSHRVGHDWSDLAAAAAA